MTSEEKCTRVAKVVGAMPPYYEVAYALWGEGVDFDSDGDSSTPEATDWRELTVILRADVGQRVDIDPTDRDQDIVKIVATSSQLLEQTCEFLKAAGALSFTED